MMTRYLTTLPRVRPLWKILFLFLFIHEARGSAPLRIAGSSAVFPFAATVAEHFHYKTHEPTPLVEATGTGAGIKLFCSAPEGSDGVMTSRPLTEGERQKCSESKVTFEEFKIGQDGLVFIQKKGGLSFPLTLKDLNEALAENVSRETICVPNPYAIWKEIQPTFPVHKIRVLGPAPTSGTYDVLIDKIRGTCGPFLRRDGAYIEAPANENLIIQKVLNAPQTMGIVTFSFYDQNKDQLQAFSINGTTPSFETIQTGIYPLSRPLYLYIKTNKLQDHPQRVAYVLEFSSEGAIGKNGYLQEKGLIPLSPEEEEVMRHRINKLKESS
jgi:phosphate transport system substrate-binding protein